MLRVLIVASLLVSLPGATAEEPHQNALRSFYDQKFEAALRVSEVVRIRFSLAAAAARCRHVENLFGYNLLLERFTDKQKDLIAAAAREGTDKGARSAPPQGDEAAYCAAALRNLQSADDELVVLAEQVSHQDSSRAP